MAENEAVGERPLKKEEGEGSKMVVLILEDLDQLREVEDQLRVREQVEAPKQGEDKAVESYKRPCLKLR